MTKPVATYLPDHQVPCLTTSTPFEIVPEHYLALSIYLHGGMWAHANSKYEPNDPIEMHAP